MTRADLEKYGGNITPVELRDAIGTLRAFITKEEIDKIPKVMQALNCLYAVIYDDFKDEIDEALKERYKDI